jgi:hypothetical protein
MLTTPHCKKLIMLRSVKWGNLMEGDHLEDAGVVGRIILKWIFERLVGGGHALNQSGPG